MNKTIQIQVPEGKVAEWKKINGVTTLVLTDEADNRPVTERIKTFDDAYIELVRFGDFSEGIAKLLFDYESNACNIKDKSTLAYMKLCIIAAALNEGWEPQLTKEKYRYYPCFYQYKQEEIDRMDDEKKEIWLRGSHYGYGLNCGIAYSHCAWSHSQSVISARLAVKSEELAVYFGQQFIDIWADYMALPHKEG